MSESTKHKFNSWRFITMIFVMFLSGMGYLYLSLWGDWEKVKQGILQVGIDGFILALAFSLVNYFIRFNRWNYFLLLLGQHVPYWKNFRIYIAGFSLTTTPGKAGEAIRSVFLHDLDIPYRKSFAAFFAERFSDLMAVVLLALVGLWNHHHADYIVLGTLGFIILALIIIQNMNWLKKIELFFKNYFPAKMAHAIEFVIETIASFQTCFSTKALTVGTILGVIAWAAEAIAFFLILILLGVDIHLDTAISIYAVSILIGALTFLPGGLGGVEVSMIQLLMLSGVDPAKAATATIVIRVATLWFSVFLGLLALPRKQISVKGDLD